jgi:hypothetical protein
MTYKDGALIFGGQARLPKELSAAEVLQAVAEVEISSGKVLAVEFNPCPPLIARMLKQMMVGMSLQNDVSDLLTEIEQRLFHKNKKAVITAIKDLFREYREYQYRASKVVRPFSEE